MTKEKNLMDKSLMTYPDSCDGCYIGNYINSEFYEAGGNDATCKLCVEEML